MDGTKNPDQPQPTPAEITGSTSVNSASKVTRKNFLLGGAAALGSLFGLGKAREANASPDPAAEHERVYGDTGHEMADRPNRVDSPDPAEKHERVTIQDYGAKADRESVPNEMSSSTETNNLPRDPFVGPAPVPENTDTPPTSPEVPSNPDEVSKA